MQDHANQSQIVNRVNKNLPNHFSNNLQDYQIVRHNVGIRPSRVNGVRVEREIKNGQVIVHAYGTFGSLTNTLMSQGMH